MRFTDFFETSIGLMGISEENGKITHLFLGRENMPKDSEIKSTDLIIKAKEQMKEYLIGKRTSFNLPINPNGTEFQMKVWQALRNIPYGQTRSYKDIAECVDNPKGARAVGMANNKNPILIITPCHRVIGANGSLTGFGAGIEVKKKLLALEKGEKI